MIISEERKPFKKGSTIKSIPFEYVYKESITITLEYMFSKKHAVDIGAIQKVCAFPPQNCRFPPPLLHAFVRFRGALSPKGIPFNPPHHLFQNI